MHDFCIKIAYGKNRKTDFHGRESCPKNYREFFAFKRNFSEAENRCENKQKNRQKLEKSQKKPYKIAAADHEQKRPEVENCRRIYSGCEAQIHIYAKENRPETPTPDVFLKNKADYSAKDKR